MSEQVWTLKKEEQWLSVIQEILKNRKGRTLLLLEAPLGAGKTTCVRYLMKELGWDHVTSPTFAIHHEYNALGEPVDHLDLYRISSEDEWLSTGLDEIFSRPRGFVIVEWASRLPAHVWPKNWSQLKLKISHLENGDRSVLFKREDP
jgi:tRNA threonylcarbamoyladenosine biosynthesis protein TsaE